MHFVRQLSVEKTIVDQLDNAAARVFRVLCVHRMLDDKSVADRALLPVEEARKALFALFMRRFVHSQEVPKSKDHASNKSIFLWTVRWDDVRRHVLDNALEIAGKILTRIQHEMPAHGDAFASARPHCERMLAILHKVALTMALYTSWTPPSSDEAEVNYKA